MRIATRGYVPSAIAAAALATIAAGLIATPASAATLPTAPSFLNVGYDGDTFTPDEYDTVSIGAERAVTFALRTHDVTAGTASVRDADGSELCTAPILGGSSGIALCTTAGPLSAGDHDVTATTSSTAGTSAESEVLHVAVHGDDNAGGGDGGDGGDSVDPAVPNPGETDPGFTAPGAGETTDPVAAPKVRLAERSGDMQSVFFDIPSLGNQNNGAVGAIKVYDAAGKLVQQRTWNGPASAEGLRLWLSAPHGEKTVYTAEYVVPQGTSARSEIVLDSSAQELPAPTFAFAPYASGDRVVFDGKGIPGATATLTDGAGAEKSVRVNGAGMFQLVGAVAKNTENTYSIVQTKDGETSKALTHVVDTRTGAEQVVAQPNPGETDPGFTAPGGDAGAGDEVPALVVNHGKVNPDGKTATISIPDTSRTGVFVFTDESGNVTERRAQPTWEYQVKVTHSGAQTFTVVKKVGNTTSKPTTVRVAGL